MIIQSDKISDLVTSFYQSYLDVIDDSKAPVAGTPVKAGEVCGYVQTYYGNEEVIPAVDGRIVAVTAQQGKDVVKGEIVAFVE